MKKMRSSKTLLIVLILAIVLVLGYFMFDFSPSFSPAGPLCGGGSYDAKTATGTDTESYNPSTSTVINQLLINRARAQAELDAYNQCLANLATQGPYGQATADADVALKCAQNNRIVGGQQLTCTKETAVVSPIEHSTNCDSSSVGAVTCTVTCKISVTYTCKDNLSPIPQRSGDQKEE